MVENRAKNYLIHLLFYWLAVPLAIILLNKPGMYYPTAYVKILIKFFSIILILLGFFLAIKSSLLHFMKTGYLPSIFFIPPRFPQTGFYSHSRHPFFLGYGLFLMGGAGFLGDLGLDIGVLVFIILIYFSLYIFKESSYNHIFEDEYKSYRKRVPFFYKIRGEKGPSILKLIAYPAFFLLSKILFPVDSEGTQNIPEGEGVLFISNHLSYLDPIFISAFCHHDLKFFTTADIYNNKFFAFILKKMDTIPVKKYQRDPRALRKLLRTLRKGDSVGYFPEGKRSWTGEPESFPDGISRVLKLVRQPIIPVSLCGLDSFMPRWSDSWRRTKAKVIYHKPFKIDRKENDEQIRKRLSKVLHSPNKNFQHRIYTSRHLNQGIERLFWRCPECGKINSIREKGQRGLFCEDCESEWLLTDDHKMVKIRPKDKAGLVKSIPEWYQKVKEYPLPELPENGYYKLKSGLCILKKKMDQSFQKLDKGYFTFNSERLIFFGRGKQFTFSFSNIDHISDPGNKTIQVTLVENQYRLLLLEGSTLKWMTIFDEFDLSG
ncbi:MAG: 1-acyl-sn-glycerol-3-phosphate acyltransferase [Candidatus Marinimicrobia bacterium]|nr:1-acyl-sn-glycerol-3-phosphate acyltransferase [Candidatus Neomarinimicrobiota bacterium]